LEYHAKSDLDVGKNSKKARFFPRSIFFEATAEIILVFLGVISRMPRGVKTDYPNHLEPSLTDFKLYLVGTKIFK